MTDLQKRPSVRPRKPRWFYELRDEAVGPVDEPTLRRAARKGDLTRNTLVWRKGLDGWQPAAAVPGVLALIEEEASVVHAVSASPAFERGPDASGAQAPVQAPATSDPAPPAPVSSRASPGPDVPSPKAEPAEVEVSSSSRPAPSRADAAPSDMSADGTPNAIRQGRSRPPPKPNVSESADDHGLGDAVSEEEERERPIREADVRELLERTRSLHPARAPAASMSAPAGSGPAPALGRVGTGPAPRPTRPLPLWAKASGVAALLLLGMGAVLLTGRPRGAAETAVAGPASRGATRGSSEAPTEPAEVGEARHTAGPGAVDRSSSDAGARAASTSEPGSTPAVVIIEGPLSPSVFEKRLNAATPMFDEQCWQRRRAAEGELAEQPSISIEIGISAWGQIEKLVAGEAPTGYRGVGRCIVGRIRGWKFPRASARTRATLRIAPSTR